MTSTKEFYKKLKHFSAREFREWAPYMSYKLLRKLDALRELRGKPIHISPAPGALGRHLGVSKVGNYKSQHNVDYHKVVKAVDIMPEGFSTMEEFREFFFQARDLGFTGIGIYPDWSPRAGAHLDVRSGRKKGDPAKWSAISYYEYGYKKQYYTSIEKAIGPIDS